MSRLELTIIARNPDDNVEGYAQADIDTDDIVTAYRFEWQDFTNVILQTGGQIQVKEDMDWILSEKFGE